MKKRISQSSQLIFAALENGDVSQIRRNKGSEANPPVTRKEPKWTIWDDCPGSLPGLPSWLFFPPHQQLRQISAAIAPSSHFLPAGDSKWLGNFAVSKLMWRLTPGNNIFLSGWKWFHPSQIGSEIQFGVKTGVYHCTLQTAKTRSQIQTQSVYLLVLLPWQPNYPDLQKNLPKPQNQHFSASAICQWLLTLSAP